MVLLKGYSETDITPQKPVELCGYGDDLHRLMTGVHDPLSSNALVLSYGDERIAIAGLDIIGLDEGIVEKVRRRVKSETGIPEGNIMLACTHTHQGPATMTIRACGERDPEYLEILPEIIANSIVKASKEWEETDILYSRGKVEDVSYNRAGYEHLDNEVFAFYLDTPDRGVYIINFPLHPVILERDNREISRDFPGRVRDYFSDDGFIFTNGACGDIDPVVNIERKMKRHPKYIGPEGIYRGYFEDLDSYANAIVETIIQGKEELLGEPKIRAVSKRIELPLDTKRRMPEEHICDPKRDIPGRGAYDSWLAELNGFIKSGEPFPECIDAEIQAIGIGDIILVGIPAEVLTEIGLKIKEKYPNVIPVTYANGNIGYIPTKEDVLKEGYGYVHGYKIYGLFPFSPEVEDALLDGVDSVIDELENKD